MRVFLAVSIAVFGQTFGRQLQEVAQQNVQEECKQGASWDFSVCTKNIEDQPVTSRGGSARITPLLSFSLGAGSLTSSNAAGASNEIGFRTGGAQDLENFRENINTGYLPLPTDVSFGRGSQLEEDPSLDFRF